MMVVEGVLVMIQPDAHVEDAQIVRVGRSTVKNCSLTCTMTGLGLTPEHSMVNDHLKSGLIDHGYAHMAIVEGVAVVNVHPVRIGQSTVKHRSLTWTLICLCSTPEHPTVNDRLKSALNY
jgi:hypothetical protein